MTTATFQVDLTANTTHLILILLYVAQFIIFWISPLKAWCSVFTHTYTPQTGSWWALPLLGPRLPLPRCWWRNCPSGAPRTLFTSYLPVIDQLLSNYLPVIHRLFSYSPVTQQLSISYSPVIPHLFNRYSPVTYQLSTSFSPVTVLIRWRSPDEPTAG